MRAPDGVGPGGAQGLGGRQVGLEGLARPGVADGEDGGDPAGVDESGGDATMSKSGQHEDVPGWRPPAAGPPGAWSPPRGAS